MRATRAVGLLIALGGTSVADVPKGTHTLTPGRQLPLSGTTSCGERAVTYLDELGELRIHVGRTVRVNGVPWPRRPELETDGIGMTAVRSDILAGLHVQISLRGPKIGIVLVIGLDDAGHKVCGDGRLLRG